MMRNRGVLSNGTGARGIEALARRLPDDWNLETTELPPVSGSPRPDAALEVRAPDGARATILVEVKERLSAQQAADLAPKLAAVARSIGASVLVIARFASPIAQQRLREAGVSYLDLTGNTRVVIDRPALFIETQGAVRDPNPPERRIRSLKGAKAARLVRALADWRPPVGVRQLALRAGTNPGYASRVLSLLEQEDVIRRDGEVAEIKWRDLLRRWAGDYDVTKTNRAIPLLASRGLDALLERLTNHKSEYALTGSFAIPVAASVSPGRLLSVYVEHAERAAKQLDLRPAERGANVLLLEPFDSVIWERTGEEAGRKRVALSQCVVDLLTGTGREPEQAEALMDWMERNEHAWRA